MNMLQDCKAELVRIGRTLKQMLQVESQTHHNLQQDQSTPIQSSTCGCGQDSCQIGNGPNTCKPHSQPITEQV
jgi:hypothetical protein